MIGHFSHLPKLNYGCKVKCLQYIYTTVISLKKCGTHMNLTWPEQHTYNIFSLSLSLSLFPEFLSLLFLTTPHNFTQFVSLVTSITTPELVSLFSFFIQRFLLFQILYISKMTKSTNKRNTLLSIETVVRENVCWLTIKILYIYIYIYKGVQWYYSFPSNLYQ